jgi:dTDP-4-dehydrorhamnose 3,5-epimerase
VRFTPTAVEGVHIVDLEPHGDERGWFSRVWCADEFQRAGLPAFVSQVSMSFNERAGTVRGLHRQTPPQHEAKLVHCIAGAVVDVAVDVRAESPTYLQHVMVELSAVNHRGLQLPAYVAHGYQTLEPGSVLLYHMDGPYAPGAEQGFRHDDPSFGIEWPLQPTDLSAKDMSWPDFVATAGQRS